MKAFSIEEIRDEIRLKEPVTNRSVSSNFGTVATPSDWDTVAWETSRLEKGTFRAKKILHLIPGEGLHLDVGTGNGDGTALISRYKKTVGVEYGQKSLLNAAKKGVLVYQADARNLPFASDQFTSITCLDVLEHIQQPELAIREMARVLKGDGVLILQTPRKEEFKERLLAAVRKLKIVKQKQPYDKPLAQKKIRELLESEGFIVLEERPIRYWASNPLEHFISISRLFYCRLQKKHEGCNLKGVSTG